jgi:hypothetical protein
MVLISFELGSILSDEIFELQEIKYLKEPVALDLMTDDPW